MESPGDAYGQPQAEGHGPSDGVKFIGDLPSELIIQIIEIVYDLDCESGIPWYTDWTAPYRLVCRRWQDIICSTPQFWQEISVIPSPKWLELCLARCAGMPVTVDIWQPTVPETTFATLCQHASTIMAFHIHRAVTSKHDLEGLSSLLTRPMPVLEALLLHGPCYVDEILDVPLTHDLVPRLTSLNLSSCIPPREIAVYTPLRSLVLRLGTKWASSYDDFLDVLGQCLGLEYLCLDEGFFDPFIEELEASEAQMGSLSRVPPLVLPSLQSVVLEGQRVCLLYFLAALHAPQATTVELTTCFDDDDDDGYGYEDDHYSEEELGLLFTRILAPDPQLRIPFLASLSSVSVSCWDGHPVEVSLRGGPDGAAQFSVDYGKGQRGQQDRLDTSIEHNLIAVLNRFSVAAVDTLEVEGWLDRIEIETWQRVFEAFVSLRTLRVQGGSTFNHLWLGLSPATASSLDSDSGHGRRAVCCPSLSEIVIDDLLASTSRFSATPELFDNVRGALGARADAGCVRLKKLQLYLGFKEQLWNETSKLREVFQEDVRGLVEELEYSEVIWKP